MLSSVKALTSKTFSLAIPIALQSVVAFAVNMIDTVMLGQLGEIELSAAAQANQLFFILAMAVGGIGDGANVLSSQAWGSRNTATIQKVLGYAYKTTLTLVAVLTFVSIVFPCQIISLYTQNPLVIEKGAEYLRIVSFSYLFYGLTTVTTYTLRAVGDVKIAAVGSSMAMGINAFLNWVLIFGMLGAPRLGVAGAAVATVIARVLEFALILWYVCFKERRIHIRLKSILQRDKQLARSYFKTSAPVIINELFWGFGESALAMIYGRMGTEVISANSISGVMNQLSSIFVLGVTSATCVITGNTIGSGKTGELPLQKKYFQTFSVLVGILAGGVIFALQGPVLQFYKVSAVTRAYASQLILITALVQPFAAFQITNMMGILRGGGDVRFAMFNDLIFLWCYTVPIGFLTAIVWQFPVWLVFVLMRLEKVFKGITSEIRLRQGKWVHAMVKNSDSPSLSENQEASV